MSQENVEAVHRGVDAMNRGEPDAILGLVDAGDRHRPFARP
jgi:hypothetical protein